MCSKKLAKIAISGLGNIYCILIFCFEMITTTKSMNFMWNAVELYILFSYEKTERSNLGYWETE